MWEGCGAEEEEGEDHTEEDKLTIAELLECAAELPAGAEAGDDKDGEAIPQRLLGAEESEVARDAVRAEEPAEQHREDPVSEGDGPEAGGNGGRR